MATPKDIWKLWRNGNIPTTCALRQFFTDHACGGSIPRKLRIWRTQSCFAIAGHLPWFLRKPAINFLAGRKIYYDFCQTDYVLCLQRNDELPFDAVRMKW